jgi:phenylpropionate dioxygenase-like ring-hydroxylating dioxygenase large terminal subunit
MSPAELDMIEPAVPIKGYNGRNMTLPASWWSSTSLFQLERRAIFAKVFPPPLILTKTWLYATQSSHFTTPGSYRTLNIAGFPFILIKGKDHTIRAFHNVCRHRAFPVLQKSEGSTLVMGCKYHGWSYDTLGKLVKAPQMDNVEGFQKAEYPLFGIHTHTTSHGHVFVNFDAEEVPGVSFEEWFAGLEVEMKEFPFEEYEL